MFGRTMPSYLIFFASLFAILLGSGMAHASTYLYFPKSHIKWKSENQEEWRRYIAEIIHDEESGRGVFHPVLSAMRYETVRTGTQNIFELFEEYRDQMPREYRWMLAALEVEKNRVTPKTLEDLRDAVLNVEISEKIGLFSRLSGVDSSLYLKENNKTKQHTKIWVGLENFVFLHDHWQKLNVLDSKVVTDPDFEKSRLRWMMTAEALFADLNFNDFLLLLKSFDAPQMRRFSNAHSRDLFFGSMWRLHRRMALRHGEPLVDDAGNTKFFFKGPEKELFDQFKFYIHKWISEDFEYLVRNYDGLVRDELTSASEVLQRPADEKDRIVLESLTSHKDLNLDGYFVANMLWLKNWGIAKDSKQTFAITDLILSILQNATYKQNGLVIRQLGFIERYFTEESFYFFVRQFYQIFIDHKAANPKPLEALFKLRTLRTPKMTDQEWTNLEWLRLKALRTNFELNLHKEYLVRIATGEDSNDLLDRRIAAEFLRREMNLTQDDISEITKRIKARAQGVKPADYKYIQDKTWARNDAELVTVVRAIQPTDLELHHYLTKIYTQRDAENPIAAETALSHLAETGTGVDQVKEEMIRKLQFVSAGDTAGTFKAFVTLYPNEGAQILEMVYRHRSAKEKLIPMLKVLIEQAQQNLVILTSIHNAVENHHDRKVAIAEYMGQTLDLWLQTQLEKRGVVLGGGFACKKILNPKAKQESP